jgi:mono/diheme cytochrome c family protein
MIIAALLTVAVVAAFPLWRTWWRWQDRSPLTVGLAELDSLGCAGCHRTPAGGWAWRADSEAPDSLASVADALRHGRDLRAGFAAPMPPIGRTADSPGERRLVAAVGALSGLVGAPDDPELEVGREIAVEMGCFGCHGPLGAGGVRSPGTVSGRIPGWYGKTARETLVDTSAIRRVISKGVSQRRLPWSAGRGVHLDMPGYGDRLDSTELELVVRYVEWLRDEHGP